jgi:hypothetical protein
MGETCSKHLEDDICIQNCGRKTLRKKAISE